MTLITGHRGARNLWPENSMQGFRSVLGLGIDAVEFDVHLTDAGELLVIHDATLDRTTDGEGPVKRLSPEARHRIKLKQSDEAIPTLAEVLEIVGAADGPPLHVELKSDEAGKPYPGIVEKVAGELAARGLSARSYLTSFDMSVLKDCRRIAPGLPRLVSVNSAWAQRWGGVASFISQVDDLVDVIAIHHELMEAEWVLVTDRLPLERLCVWTVNDEESIVKWLQRGVGHLTSDSPDLALNLRARLASAA
ncbi:glycerophosphoryl diester phosphodiesterase [Pseudorhizobium tarimense]|uniref:Glycerophosphoryl diester phosphodiesterase n=1 Tax=Pseudorhizobium tarimense TaxID=1079109 RepID=A0ABV2H5R3_9HYPH|nr:glycerophosphodiester phosphodiesterase family protein [Pseudorhizobium tarimense]MCJ8518811.1 glycerophosphodiester phosphodiesterase [Pseudorhizobium tarimense]